LIIFIIILYMTQNNTKKNKIYKNKTSKVNKKDKKNKLYNGVNKGKKACVIKQYYYRMNGGRKYI